MEITLKNDNENTTHIKHYVGMSMNQMRHLEIDRIIQDKAILSLLDLGCSEGSLLQKLGRSEKLELLVGVDIEESALSYCSINTFPENIQETIQFSRERDQDIYVYQGDATKKYKRLRDFNVQLVTMVELIEHLHPQQLPQIIQNVFAYLQPKYCFISTPNKEFNEFFQFEEGQFRHWDHKFQWDRAQFLSFCQQIQADYAYSFFTGGVGQHISDNSKGHCTQYAFFTRKEDRKALNLTEDEDELVEKAHYCNKSWRSSIDKIMRGLIFKTLYYTEEVVFEQGVKTLKQGPMGSCLLRIGETIDKQLILKYLELNEHDFEWDEHSYRLKAVHDEQVQEAQQVENSHFELSFSKSSYEHQLSISESYPRKQLSFGKQQIQ